MMAKEPRASDDGLDADAKAEAVIGGAPVRLGLSSQKLAKKITLK